MKRFVLRPGVTLVELMLFVGILGIAIVFLIPFMVFSGENQVRQQVIASVQETGAGVLQGVGRRLRDAERIMYPATIGATAKALILQSGSGTLDPTVIALSGSRLVVIEKNVRSYLTPAVVTVRNFSITNTSASVTRPSLSLSFDVERFFPTSHSGAIRRTFQSAFTLFPADVTEGDPCNCSSNPAMFVCTGAAPNTSVTWGYCLDATTCSGVQSQRTVCP